MALILGDRGSRYRPLTCTVTVKRWTGKTAVLGVHIDVLRDESCLACAWILAWCTLAVQFLAWRHFVWVFYWHALTLWCGFTQVDFSVRVWLSYEETMRWSWVMFFMLDSHFCLSPWSTFRLSLRQKDNQAWVWLLAFLIYVDGRYWSGLRLLAEGWEDTWTSLLLASHSESEFVCWMQLSVFLVPQDCLSVCVCVCVCVHAFIYQFVYGQYRLVSLVYLNNTWI